LSILPSEATVHNMTDIPSPEKLDRRSESGSAYLATLLVLVVLTILGLSLAVITQTEVLIGGSEKQATRQIFSAGSGVELATAYELVNHDPSSHRMRVSQRSESLLGATTEISDDVCTTPFMQIHTGPCNLCALNSDPPYIAAQYAVTSTSLRRGDAALGASKTIGAIISIEPWLPTFDGMARGGDVPLKTDGGVTMDLSGTSEVDPCEALFLKI
jgi:hypothetical protein